MKLEKKQQRQLTIGKTKKNWNKTRLKSYNKINKLIEQKVISIQHQQ